MYFSIRFRYTANNQFQFEYSSKKSQLLNMKLFETALKYFAFVGFGWDESSNQFFYTKKLCIPFSLCGLCLLSNIMFLIYDVSTFFEYLLVFTLTLTAILYFTQLVIMTFSLSMFDDLITYVQNMINKSECKLFVFRYIFIWKDMRFERYMNPIQGGSRATTSCLR